MKYQLDQVKKAAGLVKYKMWYFITFVNLTGKLQTCIAHDFHCFRKLEV